MMSDLVPVENIRDRIHVIRGVTVMLDRDLAALYGVETRALKQAVKRNLERFPNDFMFVLEEEEIAEVVSQTVIPSKSLFGGAAPYVFTEQGVAMLSSVLKSKRAIQVNIQIMRAFTQLHRMALSVSSLAGKIKAMERKYDTKFKVVFDAMRRMIVLEDKKTGKRIGC